MCKYCAKEQDPLCERCKQQYFTDGTKCVDLRKEVKQKPNTVFFV